MTIKRVCSSRLLNDRASVTNERAHGSSGALPENDMSQAISQTLTSQMIVVEHIRIPSAGSFEEVRVKLESMLPMLDTGIVAALRSGDLKYVTDYEENGPKLSIFDCRDHGALLQIDGRKRHALQYEIGNPVTASKMTRHRLSAALYAPLRVVLLEDEQGRSVFEYDRPSSLFGQYDDERVTEVGRHLDATWRRSCARLPNRKRLQRRRGPFSPA